MPTASITVSDILGHAIVTIKQWSCGLSLSPWPRQSIATTEKPASVSEPYQPVDFQFCSRLEPKPCTSTHGRAFARPLIGDANAVGCRHKLGHMQALPNQTRCCLLCPYE